MKEKINYFEGLPDNVSFKCKSCDVIIPGKSKKCPKCGDMDPFYFEEIKYLTGGVDNVVIIMGITGALFFLLSFFTRFSGLTLFFSIVVFVGAEYFKYKNNEKWFADRNRIRNKQRSVLNNFDKWDVITERIISKEKNRFISQWILKKLNENIPIPK